MNHIKISIAMATYNGAMFIREQLDSVYAQTLQPYEVCVVDDCSTDETVDILEEYHQKYGLRYVVNDHHLGVNQNFEKAIRNTTGDYIMFCDQDDYWTPVKNERMMSVMQKVEDKNKPCVVTCRNTYCDKNLIPFAKRSPLEIHLDSDTMDYRDTVIKHLSQGAAMVMNRKTLEYVLPFPENKDVCYDYYLGYIVAMIGVKYDMKESFIKYRIHENNVTNAIRHDIDKKSTFIEKIKHRFHTVYNVGVVPDHSIRIFKLVNEKYNSEIPKDKLVYVNNIIRLSDINLSLFQRVCLLGKLHNIPMSRRWNSLKSHILNLMANN